MYPPFRVSTLFVTFHDLGSHGAYGLKNVKILQLVLNPPGINPSFHIPLRFRLEVMWKQTGIATTVLGASGCESSVDFSSTSFVPRTSPCPVGALTATGYASEAVLPQGCQWRSIHRYTDRLDCSDQCQERYQTRALVHEHVGRTWHSRT